MKKFNVLDRSLNIHQHYLLEASAGTGKTFSIEHLVVRFLIEDTPLTQILVVTFTRAATRDLKQRIQENIQKALEDLTQQYSSFDYLQAIIENGELDLVKKRLENALFNFDQAQITTIHSFCLRMLTDYGFTANLSLDMPESENSFPKTEILQIVHDYFRTELSEFRPSVIKLIFGKFQNTIEKLEAFLLGIILNGKEVEEQLDYQELFYLFQEVMPKVKTFGFTYEDEVPHFKDLCDKKGQIKSDKREKLEGFQKLLSQEKWTEDDFDWLILDQLFVLKAFDPSQLKSKGEDRKRGFFDFLKQELYPLIHINVFLAKLASECHKKVLKHLREIEKFRYDDLLKMMKEALLHQDFTKAVREQYRMAIIDEFQDTDPIQWCIFRDLFLRDDKLLYLVGDPKQSIYAFRQADIYTYLDAVNAMGDGHLASLNVNYRSQPSLINALNALFEKSEFLKLPKLGSSLKYRPIEASPTAPTHPFKDAKGSLHFPVLDSKQRYNLGNMESKDLFPFIVQEIQKLVANDGLRYEQMAILVADRYQAERLNNFLMQWKIPTVNQKQKSLVDSVAFLGMRELLKAVLNPRDLGLIKRALGGVIFGWTHEEILSFEPILTLEWFAIFHEILINQGFASFFQQLMEYHLMANERTISEKILARDGGEALYKEIYQIAEILIVTQASSNDLLSQMRDFEMWHFNEDERVMKREEKTCKAVNIMTIHSSKGLEFDVVFLLGLLKRTKWTEVMYPVTVQNQTVYKPIVDQEAKSFQNYCHEIDAEKMRQLYVAMTRAKYRVYAPIFIKGEKQIPGISSPMELFFNFKTEEFHSHSDITFSKLEGEYDLKVSSDNQANVLIQKPLPLHIQNGSERIGSFTSLVKKIEPLREPLEKFVETPTSNTFGTGSQYPTNFFIVEKNVHTLPVGSKTGNLIHKLLENLSFTLPSEHYLSYVQPYIKRTTYQDWGTVFIDLLVNALHTPFIFGEESFCLKDVNPNEIVRETEFLYPKQMWQNPRSLLE